MKIRSSFLNTEYAKFKLVFLGVQSWLDERRWEWKYVVCSDATGTSLKTLEQMYMKALLW